jgi:hypothetical protein
MTHTGSVGIAAPSSKRKCLQHVHEKDFIYLLPSSDLLQVSSCLSELALMALWAEQEVQCVAIAVLLAKAWVQGLHDQIPLGLKPQA